MEKEVELVKQVIDFHHIGLENNNNNAPTKIHDKLQDIQPLKRSSDK